LKRLFLTEAEKNKVFPIGAGIWLRIHPEDRIATPYKSWRFDQTTTRMAEFAAPGLGVRAIMSSSTRSSAQRLGRSLCAWRRQRRPDALSGSWASLL